MAVTCKSCRFFFKDLYCRRYPPIFNSVGLCMMFPEVSSSDWCGEYKRSPKEESPARPTPKVSKEDMNEVIEAYMTAFCTRFRSQPSLLQADYAAVKKMITEDGVEKAKNLVVEFVTNTPQFYNDHKLYDLRHVPKIRNTLTVSIDKRNRSNAVMSDKVQHGDASDWPDYVDYVKKSEKHVSYSEWKQGNSVG